MPQISIEMSRLTPQNVSHIFNYKNSNITATKIYCVPPKRRMNSTLNDLSHQGPVSHSPNLPYNKLQWENKIRLQQKPKGNGHRLNPPATLAENQAKTRTDFFRSSPLFERDFYQNGSHHLGKQILSRTLPI